MSDNISRQAVIDALYRCRFWSCNGSKVVIEFDDAYDAVCNVPPSDRKGHWIPCSERLPEKPYGCLVTVESSRFDGGEFVECESILPYFVGYDENDWYDDDGERCQYEVIAWMPLPEPYKKGD